MPTTLVSVPEAAVDKHRDAPPGENDVGTSLKRSGSKAKTISEPMEQSTNRELGIRVAASDPPHDLGTAFWRDRIHAAIIQRKIG